MGKVTHACGLVMAVHFLPETRCICKLVLRLLQPLRAAISWFLKPEMHREALSEGGKAQMKIAHVGHAELLVPNLEAVCKGLGRLVARKKTSAAG